MSDKPQDPLEFLKSMWGGMGFPLPGIVTPTLDANELEKRIADLKAVEGWLKMNLGMLQISIQGMEMQRVTLAAMQSLGQSGGGGEGSPLANPALWPWNFMPQAATAADAGSPPVAKPGADSEKK